MASINGADSISPTVPPSLTKISFQIKDIVKRHTSIMHTSGSSPVLSAGILDTRSIQSWIAVVTCGTICTVFPR